MSERYPGGIISKTAPVPTGPYQNGTAPGVWTLDQQAAYTKQGIWPTAGNLDPNLFIENLFSTYLYTGNNSSQTVTNGIDLSGEGGLVWIKSRSSTTANVLTSTENGVNVQLFSNTTTVGNSTTALSSFNSNGFSFNANANINTSAANYVSWSFRKQPKFFDCVTWTGDGIAGRTVAHNLGSAPGCIIVKCTSLGEAWAVYHRGLDASSPANYWIRLDGTAIRVLSSGKWNNTAPSAETFTLGNDGEVNGAGKTYVAYLFAHDAGGFGGSGADNVVSCGSYTGNGSSTGPVVTLGYEPQWVLVKSASGTTANWFLYDTIRGFPTATGSETRRPLIPNSVDNETTYSSSAGLYPTPTGFSINTSAANFNQSGATYIYVAIRRGPMKTPTLGTSVFQPVIYTGNGTANRLITSGIVTDFVMARPRDFTGNGGSYLFTSRLTDGNFLESAATNSQTLAGTIFQTPTSGVGGSFSSMVGFGVGLNSTYELNRSSALESALCLQRAPGFMDVCCYTGTGSATTFSHNLTSVPELMIVRKRDNVEDWGVYTATTGNTGSLRLNSTASFNVQSTVWNNTTPTASVFTVGSNGMVNASGSTYVAYLFASCPGVSKVGSYTGTGTTLQVDCGFTGGARFVMIKRTDSTGAWYVWDSARGIVSGNDPYLLFNSGSAEVTSTDYVDTYSAGFEISSTAPAAINASGGTFIFLAIA